jgi:excisionase family DNA binding protein
MSAPPTVTAVIPIPTLDELAADPARAAELPVDAAERLLGRAIAVQGVIYGRLLAARADSAHPPASEDRLLTVTQAAERLSTTKDWLYRHARQLSFTVKSGRQLRFSSAGIDRYIREHQST